MNWNAVDLNLLRVLDALLADANTTRAAQRIGLSQPAVSAGLSRLRSALNDPLFVREGNRLVPTQYATQLRAPLRDALGAIEKALGNSAKFEPELSALTFRVLADDYFSALLLGDLAKVLAAQAPKMRVELLPIGPKPIAPELADGSIDIAFDQSDRSMPEWIDRQVVLRAEPVIIAARGHQALRAAECGAGEALPLDLFCALHHAAFSPGGNFVPLEDAALATMGRQRHIAITLPTFLSIAHLVSRSELIGLIPAQMAHDVADGLCLDVYRSPLTSPPVSLSLFWHARNTGDAAHAWVRNTMIDLLARFSDEA